MINPETYVFNFGQYLFYTYNEVLKIDPGYIKWCAENLADFDLPEDAIVELEERLAQ